MATSETTGPPPTSAVTSPTASSTPTAQAVLKPLAVAPTKQGLAFDSWSPDGRWIAYWVGAAERPARLAFVNVQTGRMCQHDEVSAQDWSRRVIWRGHDQVTAVVNQQGEALAGTVCDALTPVEAVAFPGCVTADDPSPDGRYRAEERIVRWEGEAEYKTLVIAEPSTGRTVATVSYVGSPHIPGAGQGWLNDQLYLIGKTVDQGVLYVSLPEGRIGHVLPNLLGLNESDEEYIWLVQSQANPVGGEYHLLLQEYQDDAAQFPLLLYHSELDQLEEVPFYLAWPFFEGSFSTEAATPSASPTAPPTRAGIRPASAEACSESAMVMQEALGTEGAASEVPFEDYINNQAGTGCQVTVTGTGADFGETYAIAEALQAALQARGWKERPEYRADMPGTVTGWSKGNELCLLAVLWKLSADANCPKDQPLSDCEIQPDQQLYTITLNCARMSD